MAPASFKHVARIVRCDKHGTDKDSSTSSISSSGNVSLSSADPAELSSKVSSLGLGQDQSHGHDSNPGLDSPPVAPSLETASSSEEISTVGSTNDSLPSLSPPSDKPSTENPLSGWCLKKKGSSLEVDIDGDEPACQLFALFKALAAGNDEGHDAAFTPDGRDDNKFTDAQMLAAIAKATEHRRASMADADLAAAHEAGHVAVEDDASSSAGSEPESVKRWLEDTTSKHEAMGERFAAVSVSHMSPFTAEAQAAHTGVPTNTSNTADPTPGNVLNVSHDDVVSRFRRDDIPAEEKLAVINEEYGEIASLMVNADGVSEPERLLAESQGSIFKGVMMIGNLHLTTHRLVFHALLPPEDMYTNGSAVPMQTESEATARSSRPDVIIAGSVTLHSANPLKRARRVWMELSPDMLTAYPSADDAGRVRPLFSILLSTALKLEPINEAHPCDFNVRYLGPHSDRTLHFTVDNDASALRWRRHMDGVLFRQMRERFRGAHGSENSNEWGLLRCCLPLDRTSIKGVGDYHSFATLVNLEIELEQHKHIQIAPMLSPEAIDMLSAPKHANALSEPVPVPEAAPSSASGSTTPASTTSATSTRNRSIRSVLPSFKRASSRDNSPSRNSSPSRMSLDGPLPARMQRYAGAKKPPTTPLEEPNLFNFLVAVLNEQSWFVEALTGAVEDAHKRTYKEGITPAKMVLDVGGHDCLKSDDDDGSDASILTKAYDDDDEGKPYAVVEARKAEKAHMAARMFGLREDEGVWLKRCYVQYNHMPSRGHIIVNPQYICFWRRTHVGADIKYRFSTKDVKGAVVAPPIRPGLHGLVLKIDGHHDLKFELFNEQGRADVIAHINAVCQTVSDSAAVVRSRMRTDTTTTESSSLASSTSYGSTEERWNEALKNLGSDAPEIEVIPTLVARGADKALQHAAGVLAPPPDMLMYPKSISDTALSYMPFVANRPWSVNAAWNLRLTPRTFTMLTIGSRGDVQPYIALGLRLMQDGHKVVIVTHDEFKKWIEGYGIEHRQAGGDPTALMKLSTEHRMFSPGFFTEALGGFRAWFDALLLDSWNACQGADVLIESPSAMAGVHIAEALKIPYFRAFTMPWTRTATYPQAFMVPAFDMGPSFNYSTYVLFDNIMWRASSGQINRWRKKTLGLDATDQSSLSINKVPFLYNFSPAVVPKPLDWNDDITITGYWNLENSDMDWEAPQSLLDWMDKARADGKPIVYIGFGSIVVPDPAAMTRAIIKGVEKADVRAIVAKGWSTRDAKEGEDPVQWPDNCYPLDKVPHGWLFPKIDAAMHHGGAGTTGASLRAGIPTIIKPWFGDQHFWALRVTKLEVGVKVAALRADEVAEALRKATTSTVMIEKARRIGERITQESGVDAAVQAIHFNLVRAAKNRAALKKQDHKAVSTPAFPTLPKLAACKNA